MSGVRFLNAALGRLSGELELLKSEILRQHGLEHAEVFMEMNMELFHKNDHTFSTQFNFLLSEQRRR